jgi:hypothetical protein
MERQVGFFDFIRSYWPNWFALMSGGPSVPAAIAALYVESDVAKICLWVTAAVCFVLSSFFVWRKERQEVLALEQQLQEIVQSRALLELRLEGGEPYRRESQGWFYWQLSIFNRGQSVAEYVTVKLLSIAPTPSSAQVVGVLDYPMELRGPAQINPNSEAHFEILRAAPASAGLGDWRLSGIGRSQRFHPQLDLVNGHTYEFSYRAEAANAESISFTLIVSATSLGITVKGEGLNGTRER